MMGATGGFPIDLILFGAIAAFLVLRLRSVLGKRQGYEHPPEAAPRPDLRVVEGGLADAPAADTPTRGLPAPDSQAARALVAMRAVDSNFTPDAFLAGAQQAFGIIVTAFAAGDRETLRQLLSPETYAAFDGAIAGRETAGETQRTEIRAIHATSIEAAELRGGTASITVAFTTDQVNLTLDRDGREVAGTDAVTEMRDLWTFERDLGSPDPIWRLMAARSA